MSDATNLFWHEKTWIKFASACSNNHLPHAMLLLGAKGVGKLIFAEKMVKSLLCINPNSTSRQACNACQGCKTYESGANPDFIKVQLLEDKKQIGVDQIRQLSKFLTLSRSFDAYRVVLISPVEKMNQNAANSLLKSLEEPSNNTVIILTATHLSNILPTIISRSQLLSLPLPAKEQAISWIKSQQLESGNPEELLEISSGSPLLAINIDNNVLLDRENFSKDLLSIISESISVTDIAKKWEKYDQTALLDWQIVWAQSLIKKACIPSFTTNEKTHFVSLNKNIPEDMLWNLYRKLLGKKQIIHTSVNPLMNLESLLLLWLQASHI